MTQDFPIRDQSKHVGSRVHELKEKAADQLSDIPDRLVEQGREASERVQEVAGNVKGAVERSVKNQPVASLAIALGMGFVLGALWKT